MSSPIFDNIVTDFTPYSGGVRAKTFQSRIVAVHAPERYFVPELSTSDQSKLRTYVIQTRHFIPAGAIAAKGKELAPSVVMPVNYETARLLDVFSSMLRPYGDDLGDWVLNNGQPRDWSTKYTVDVLTLLVPYRIVQGTTKYTYQNMVAEADSVKLAIMDYINANTVETVYVEEFTEEFDVYEGPQICPWGLGSSLATREISASDVILVAYYPTALQLVAHIAQFLNAPIVDVSYLDRVSVPNHKLHWADEKLLDYINPQIAIYVGLDDEVAASVADALRDAGVSEVHGLVETNWNSLVIRVATAIYRTWDVYGIICAYQDMAGDFAAIASGYSAHLLALSNSQNPDPISVALAIRQAIGQDLPILLPPRDVNESWFYGVLLAKKYIGGEDVPLPPRFYSP